MEREVVSSREVMGAALRGLGGRTSRLFLTFAAGPLTGARREPSS
ncbi:MAG: hypothetical protein JWL67_2275, partial [Solirubrobacterales bacterium]|nr:hypothetical protein [Solirubrobacterales bacterium]